jgi:antitoxin VapB
MASTRHVRLFRNGRNQAVRIPREFELPGEEAILHKDKTGRLILESVRPRTLAALVKTWSPLAEEFPEIHDLPAESVDL